MNAASMKNSLVSVSAKLISPFNPYYGSKIKHPLNSVLSFKSREIFNTENNFRKFLINYWPLRITLNFKTALFLLSHFKIWVTVKKWTSIWDWFLLKASFLVFYFILRCTLSRKVWYIKSISSQSTFYYSFFKGGGKIY